MLHANDIRNQLVPDITINQFTWRARVLHNIKQIDGIFVELMFEVRLLMEIGCWMLISREKKDWNWFWLHNRIKNVIIYSAWVSRFTPDFANQHFYPFVLIFNQWRSILLRNLIMLTLLTSNDFYTSIWLLILQNNLCTCWFSCKMSISVYFPNISKYWN